jgi:hypothetical protein
MANARGRKNLRYEVINGKSTATLILLRYKEREDEAKKLSKNSASLNSLLVHNTTWHILCVLNDI